MTIKTKDRIIEKAIQIFNENGFMNVSMQRLADESSLSPGNLTYHYPKKEDLMLALYDHFQQEMQKVIPSPTENTATLSGIDQQITSFYELQQRFLFFYLDLLEIERSYHVIAKRHYDHIDNQIHSIYSSLSHNESLGYLSKQQDDEIYKSLAQQLWFTAVFWPKQCRVRGVSDRLEDLRRALWTQIRPYLTKTGASYLSQAQKPITKIS